MPITNLTEANALLAGYVPGPKVANTPYKLERMQKLMQALGNPQEKYKIVHIAGTSGKTSTAYYIAALLKEAGKKVGLTVSPHIDDVNERVQIDLKPMGEKQFCAGLSEFVELIKKTDIKPTYFELLVAFAFWEFARAKVDYAVVEVGLGGLLDGTNVIEQTGKVCVITDIGLDHTNVLGASLAEIAAQKAGIIQKGNKTFIYRQAPEVMHAVEQRCLEQNARLGVIEPQVDETIAKNLPAFQRRNWNLAYQVFNSIEPKNKLTRKQLLHTTKTYVPARMEIIKKKEKTIVLDGAHNAQKLRALVSSIKEKFPDQKAAMLFTLADGKNLDVEAAVLELKPITERVIITTFDGQQDLPKHSISPEQILAACEQVVLGEVKIIKDPKKAFNELQKSKQDLLVVAGSFYLLNHIRPLIFDKGGQK